MKDGHILVWPNTVPFNGMLLSGKLPFKTRSLPPIHDYRGVVLFYNSSKYANQHKVLREGIDPKLLQMQSIVGQGFLKEVRQLSDAEMADFSVRCKGIYNAFPLGYFFENLLPFPQSIPAMWPHGTVRGGWVHSGQFQPWLDRAFALERPKEFDEHRMPIQSKIFRNVA